MPKVGTKKFSYTKKGKAAAKSYAKKAGKKIMTAKKPASPKKTKKGY
jgi:hypothetical protein